MRAEDIAGPGAATDAELARTIIEAPPGSAPAEEAELYQRFARRVRLYGLRHLRDDEAARDLAQQVLLLTFYAEKTTTEVGQALGLAEGHVRVIRHRALEQLRHCFAAGKVAS